MRFIDEEIRVKFSLGQLPQLKTVAKNPEEWEQNALISLKAYLKKFNIAYKPDYVANTVQVTADYYEKMENTISFELDVIAEDEYEAVLNYYNLHILSKSVMPKTSNGIKQVTPNLRIEFSGMPYIFKYTANSDIIFTNVPLTLVTNFSYNIDLDKGMSQMKMNILGNSKQMLIPNAFSLTLDCRVIKYDTDLTVEKKEILLYETDKINFLNSVGSKKRSILIGSYDYCDDGKPEERARRRPSAGKITSTASATSDAAPETPLDSSAAPPATETEQTNQPRTPNRSFTQEELAANREKLINNYRFSPAQANKILTNISKLANKPPLVVPNLLFESIEKEKDFDRFLEEQQ